MPQKPTAAECLDVLSMIWHRCAPKDLEVALDKIDAELPNWHTRMAQIAEEAPSHVVERMYQSYTWRRCRELLKQAGYIK